MNKSIRHWLLLVGAGCIGASALAEGLCPPPQWPVAALEQLQRAHFKLDDEAARQALARALLPCLADPDPPLRDGLAYETLRTWMRGKQLSQASVREVLAQLQPRLAPEASDSQGFAAPFAALTLAEVARADRLQPFLQEAERAALVSAATLYLRNVRDYRGFVAGEGWRHGVAHGADLLLQLALNPALGAAQLEQIVAATLAQVVAANGHAYIHGESERLVRPVLFAARRGPLAQGLWDGWLRQLANPAPLASWDQAFSSSAGLARVHNTQGFLLALYFQVQNDPKLQPLLGPGVLQALKDLP